MSADVLSVLRAFAEDYRATIPKVYAQKRKKMKLAVADLDKAIAEVAELIEAGNQLEKTYGWLWDLDDGSVALMPDRIEEFEQRWGRLGEALSRARGES